MTEIRAITVEAIIDAPLEKVWECWTLPVHIIRWNFASDDWHSPSAENDLKPAGRFSWRMEAKDGTVGFDFSGEYVRVEEHHALEYVLDDKRKVKISFTSDGEKTTVTETFEVEHIYSVEMQEAGWQAILDNFKKYTESIDIDKSSRYIISGKNDNHLIL